jgi:hypothetical protein
MGYCVVPAQAVVGVGGWVVWLGIGRSRSRKRPVDYTSIMLGVGQSYGGRAVVLRVVLLLLWLLLLVAVATAVAAHGGRGRALVHLRRAGAANEQLVVRALCIAVAASRRISVARSPSVGVVAIIGAWRSAIVVRVLVLARRTAVAGVGYAGIVVVLPVPVVRHGAGFSRRRERRRDGGWVRLESSFTGLPGEVARAACPEREQLGWAGLGVGGDALWPDATTMQQSSGRAVF